MRETLAALAEEFNDHIRSRRVVVILIVIPAFLASFGGGIVGGIISGHALDRKVRDQIDRANATHAAFDAADITLHSGPGRLGQMIVFPKSNRTIINPVTCPPHVLTESICFTVERNLDEASQ